MEGEGEGKGKSEIAEEIGRIRSIIPWTVVFKPKIILQIYVNIKNN